MVEIVIGGVTRVVIGRGVLDAVAVLGGVTPGLCALVTQRGAAPVAAAIATALGAAGFPTAVVEVPDGEAAKTLGSVEALCRSLAEAGMTRADLIIGVGGGAVADLAGFAAAVYLRGVRVHLVATTLLAAVDAAVGGKTGVNLMGKNLVGVFRHPHRVLIDLEILEALPAAGRRQGLSEALKAGLVGDPALFELLERDGVAADLSEVVSRAVAVKAGIVEEDFEERGVRAHLNYGHTVGHALEATGALSHGDAIAIGMVAAGRASALDAGFGAEVRQTEAIRGLGLPVAVSGVAAPAVIDLLRFDKKRDASGLRMVLLEAIGRPRVAHVGSATVEAALRAAGISGGRS